MGEETVSIANLHVPLNLGRADAGLDLLVGASVGGVEEVRDVDARLLDLGAEVVVALEQPVVLLERLWWC